MPASADPPDEREALDSELCGERKRAGRTMLNARRSKPVCLQERRRNRDRDGDERRRGKGLDRLIGSDLIVTIGVAASVSDTAQRHSVGGRISVA